MSLDLLPEDCFAHIISLTSPGDACRLSSVSLSVHSIANLDSLWVRFLPSDYRQILSRLVHPVVFSSNKELFMRLCCPRLIDGGRKIFSLQKSTCKKCYLLSARELSITWSSYPLYWTWKPLVESRFAEVAELRTICWLEISSTVNTQMLSPKTFYGAYLIVKFAERAYGLDTFPSEVSVQVGNIRSQGQVYLSRNERKKQLPKQLFGLNQVEAFRTRMFQGEKEALFERKDGWVEIELGSFYNDGNDKEVNMSLKEVKGQHLKGGIIVEGIELRPKD
ncbi:F-box protein PP2-B15 [Ziziphus jujuba]|uniref:F-box protein PP2-B15 n=2 Tax=Ziziphus jujuba TaxID=326968 RepID=A0A6P6FZN6_ZIZJJ|nr:F-box protein PP2-B15 [Ziziphus jujuba]KAH7542999.1 hypothetical protein FEM48_Zijuj02G0135400 [Ziziphus jujuba var. spinosa]